MTPRPALWRRLLLMAALAAVIATPRAAGAVSQVPAVVGVDRSPDGRWTYTVDGQPQPIVGMGYNPIYGRLRYDQRAGAYYRDFKLLCQAGVNTITGWDADKGFEQDTFGELILDAAYKYGIGVVMPFYLPVNGDYANPAFDDQLMTNAEAKITRYKNHPALRMWGVGNEVLADMPPDRQPAFMDFFLRLIDLFHSQDANHPVIYRDAEDRSVPLIADALAGSGDMRPWFLYGMNIYNKDPGPLLDAWPSHGLNRPLLVSEFGFEAPFGDARAQGYAMMWRSIRARSPFVLGAAPYVWTTAGPEPTDVTWGLMNADAQSVDSTFDTLRQLWLTEPGARRSCTG
jgi:hypothetical protein